jgi:dihydrofolate reductase
MGRVVVFESVSLDGVMQAPARPDEDRRGGFERGGWAVPYAHPSMWEDMDLGTGRGLLLGRRTYEDFFAVWPNQTDNPFTDVLNRAQKYVASTTLREPLPWMNSTLLTGDTADAVAELKGDNNLLVLGSGDLVRFLMAHGLVDELILLIHPLVLGAGVRLFAEDGQALTMKLAETKATPTGVVIATYRAEARSTD